MPDLEDGESIEVQGSGSARYVLKNVGEVYSCTCPAWRNQSLGLEKRTCKHLRALRGDAAELARVGAAAPARAPAAAGKAQEGPPLLLANPWDNDQDLSGWWMSEKLDGVRAYWDGKDFISRLGNRYHAPDWFTAGLPETPLDGENTAAPSSRSGVLPTRSTSITSAAGTSITCGASSAGSRSWAVKG